ncbi:expressed unknown protein [Seminavis robusta]|uniref:Uncharacterized protein n=1 Tax=Seminavis robusta TaxID=568900 RepID=A0A9N8EJI7_9STRA|nr:expressed unknown protein [Seminavis robusta]|eukprot:Sro1059_g236550.1 n/a (500) ;mRNA; f:24962-26461
MASSDSASEYLQEYMKEDQFHNVEQFIEKARNLENLQEETSIEIRAELLPALTIDDDAFDSNNFPDTTILELEIRGHTTKAYVAMSTGTCFEEGYMEAGKEARKSLLQWIAESCPKMESLRLQGSMYHIMYTMREYVQGRDASEFYDDFSDWTNIRTMLQPFADAGHWKERLRNLEIDGCDADFDNNNLKEGFQTWPVNLQTILLTCIYGNEDTVNQLIKAFPTVLTVVIRCPEKDICDHYETAEYSMVNLIEGLEGTNKSIRSLTIRGRDDDGTIQVREDQFSQIFQILRGLPCLKKLHIDSAELSDSFAEEVMRILPMTPIQEIYLKGMKISELCFGHLQNYLSQDAECKLVSFDLNVATLNESQIKALFEILVKTAAPKAKLANHRTTTLDFLLVMRRFRHFLTMEASKAATIWALILSRANDRRNDQWLNTSSEWGGYRTQTRLNRSLVFALLRHRVDIISDALQSRAKGTSESGAPGKLVEPPTKRTKQAGAGK